MPGNLRAPDKPGKWLGITPADTWKTAGRNVAIIVSLATMNAFTEEAITHLNGVTALDGALQISDDERRVHDELFLLAKKVVG
ncbi:MAG TPA: hypothetical protein VLH85_09670 [Levilinea sp.]|nr:hypothetical protein [Levilinea sp.]